MLSKKKKIFIVAGFVMLLAITGILNIIINNNVVKNVNAGLNSATTANFFTTYRTDRQDTRNQEIVYLDAIISSASSSAEAKTAAETKNKNLLHKWKVNLFLKD